MSEPPEIFRKKALEHYQQGSVKHIYPRFFSPRLHVVCWCIFFLLIGLVCLAWFWNIAQYAQGTGIIQSTLPAGATVQKSGASLPEATGLAVLFFSSQFSQNIQRNASIELRIAGIAQPVIGSIERVDLIVLKPEEARQRYHLSAQIVSAMPASVVTVFAQFPPISLPALANGKRVDARLQIGSLNSFSLF